MLGKLPGILFLANIVGRIPGKWIMRPEKTGLNDLTHSDKAVHIFVEISFKLTG